ncbi:hypothetical protein EON63_00385 [archaeon]|nr:MAG: hypothetical protein EON63_00385 [archaeon]
MVCYVVSCRVWYMVCGISYCYSYSLHHIYFRSMEAGPLDSWGKFRSKKDENKIFIEAKLGNTVDNKGRFAIHTPFTIHHTLYTIHHTPNTIQVARVS